MELVNWERDRGSNLRLGFRVGLYGLGEKTRGNSVSGASGLVCN